MKKFVYLAVFAVVLFTACRKESGSGIESKDAIRIDMSIDSPQTRWSYNDDGTGTFAATDVVGMYAVKVSTDAVIDNFANFAFGFNGSNAAIYWEDLMTSKVRFAGYFPKAETVADPAAYTFSPNGTLTGEATVLAAATNNQQCDLLLGASDELAWDGQYESDGTTLKEYKTTIQFRHVLHRINVELTADGGYTTADLRKVTLFGMKPTAKVNILTAAYTAAEGSVTPVEATPTEGKCSFYVAPQGVTTDADFLVVEVMNSDKVMTYKVKVPATITSGGETVNLTELESGKILTMKVTIAKTGITLTGSTITPWGDQGSTDEKKPEIDFGE